MPTLRQVEDHLTSNRGIYSQEWTPLEVAIIKEKLVGAYSLITTKPIIYLINLTAADYKRMLFYYVNTVICGPCECLVLK